MNVENGKWFPEIVPFAVIEIDFRFWFQLIFLFWSIRNKAKPCYIYA